MRRVTRAFAALNLAAAGTVVAFVAATPAQADTLICEQYGTTTIQGRYIVQNNRWGSNAEQCINVTDTGFTIVRQAGSAPTNGAPLSYPSVFYGCHYTNCSPGTNLPMQVSQISSATSSISYTYTSGTYNASYDIWLDPTPKRDGVNQMEIMIWFNRQGSIQPIGSQTGTATIAGRTWEVWTGSNGANNVISYVSPSPISSWSFSVLDFIHDVRNRGMITDSWYLTSIQAGFEPWNGGVGLAVNSFSATVNGGGNPGGGGGGGNPGGGNGGGGNPGGGGGGATSCRVTYTPDSWPGGFTANVTITNTGSSTIDGWTLTYTLPAGQTINQTWNATITQNGSQVTARNVSYNGTLAPGASTTFGYLGSYTGSYASPTSFSLNGTTCSS